MRAIFLLIFLLGRRISANLDDFLPVYMRGIGWDKVEEYLKEDLRLSDSVVPTNYLIDLMVNVRGYAEAKRSNFNGTVYINLNIIKPVSKVELHSVGLIINKAELVNVMEAPAGVTRMFSNAERETIRIHFNRTIYPNEKFTLKIRYRGMARMDEYGLYESWDPKYNELDEKGPFVLASRNFPSGARSWFPSFDEPDKRATVQLQVNYPSGLNAYSNTEMERSENVSNSRTFAVFKKTNVLPTYQVALSINHFQRQDLDVNGFGEVRLMNSKSSNDFYSMLTASSGRPAIYDIPACLRESVRRASFGGLTKDKLDIIILEGSSSNSMQPGLITIGRANLWRCDGDQDLRNLTQLSAGNLIPVRATNEMWLNDMFSYIVFNQTTFEIRPEILSDQVLFSSLHERPLRDQLIHSTSTKQYLSSRNALPSLKMYLDEHIGRFHDIDDFIKTLSNSCEDIVTARAFLKDFINQPGKALLIVKRSKDHVSIEQKRHLSTYFDRQLRDYKTRYTIPIFYTIDGLSEVKLFHKNETSLNISVPETSLFHITHEYDHLYLVIYEDVSFPKRNISEEERQRMASALTKSMVVSLNIGYVKYDRMLEILKDCVKRNLFNMFDLENVIRITNNLISIRKEKQYPDQSMIAADARECETRPSWVRWFLNDTVYWDSSDNNHYFARQWHCMAQFLENNFIGVNTVIRPIRIELLAHRNILLQWKELHRFFFKHASDLTNHRFDLLADTVLNQARVGYGEYPYSNIHVDYIKELREFVLRNPQRAASMSTEIAMRLEREFIRDERPRFITKGGEEPLFASLTYSQWREET